MQSARYQPKPADADVSTNEEPAAKIAPSTNRQRNEFTRPRAAEIMVGSLNFSTQQTPARYLRDTLLAFRLTDRLY